MSPSVLIVTGGRNWNDPHGDAFNFLSSFTHSGVRLKMICGGASGADSIAMAWAQLRKVDHFVLYPDWALHGKSAGPMRNLAMAALAKNLALVEQIGVAAFPGGAGTASMLKAARRQGFKIFDYHHWRSGE